jgi:hypothetical protein
MKKGTCVCDKPQSAHDVRRLKLCIKCAGPALDGVPYGPPRGVVHVRCLLRECGLVGVIDFPGALKRARLCCLGPKHMQKLLAIADEVQRLKAEAQEGKRP